MKHATSSILAAGFKAFAAVLLIALVCVVSLAMKANKVAQDVWKQLGLTPQGANININVSFNSGMLQYAGAKNAKNIAAGDRVAIIKQLVAYAKKYTGSPEFKSEYTRRRAVAQKDFLRRNPEPQVSIPTAEDIKAEEKQRLENQLKAAEAGLNSPNPKIKNAAPARIEHLKKQITALDDPNNPLVKRKRDEAERIAGSLRQQHAAALQKFEERYPEDPKVLLQKRLQEIVAMTNDVDYAAELKEGYNGKKVFVNPAYERKPAEWKLAFRAGKPATDAVRAAAQQWLGELNSTARR